MPDFFKEEKYQFGDKSIVLLRRKIPESAGSHSPCVGYPYNNPMGWEHQPVLFHCLSQKPAKALHETLKFFPGELCHIPCNEQEKLTLPCPQGRQAVNPIDLLSFVPCMDHSVDALGDTVSDDVKQFAMWLKGQLCGSSLFVLSLQPASFQAMCDLQKSGTVIRETHAGKRCPDDSFLVTTFRQVYELARHQGFNAVLVHGSGSFTRIQGSLRNEWYVKRHLAFVSRYSLHQVPFVRQGCQWPILQAGDTIDLVAFSSAYDPTCLPVIQKILESYGLKVRDCFARQCTSSLEYAHSDRQRFSQLRDALFAPDSQAVWAIKGGSGSSRLMADMLTLTPPDKVKPLIGFSDVTGMHLCLNTLWNWPTLHGILASCNREVSRLTHTRTNCQESVQPVLDILMGRLPENTLSYRGIQPLNLRAQQVKKICAPLLGGNMTLICNLADSPFIPLARDHILILEDIGVSPRQAERFLDLFRYSRLCQSTQVIILGEFLEAQKPSALEATNMRAILHRFAQKTEIPVFYWPEFGHGKQNRPLPLNCPAILYPSSTNSGFVLTSSSC
ncbi:Murein tetrapeptide carboxypeptidase [invertebrate metagenome]|uniref:Murein tetrapeptide carboxypeptidase n=1 Tax=invertebrate metagenome TaxID=1711999 RepID=A0A2H9T5V0_9ZZZZ